MSAEAFRDDARRSDAMTVRVGRRWETVVLTATLVGALFGPLDLAGQVHTPYPYANLFNSLAVWAAVAFVFGRWATEVIPAVAGAVIVMVVAVETYYVADVLVRGANTSNLWSTVTVVWLALGVAAGLCFGAAGALSTRNGTWTGAAAAAIVPAVFLSEAAHEATTSAEADWMIVLIVCAAVTTLWLLRRADRTSVQRTLVCLTAWSFLGFVAYLPFG